jgi:hypothetical protein
MSDAAIVTVNGNGTIEYRASALGGCEKALLAARLGYDAIPLRPDTPILKTFAAGHRIEDEVLAAHFPHVTMRQEEVRLAITNRIHVVGHIDGFNDGELLEIKSQNQQEFERFELNGWETGLFPKYKWQVSAYMLGLGMQPRLRLIRALRDENGEWTGKMSQYLVHFPFYSEQHIRERILKIEAMAATGVLLADCIPSFPCPYFYLHDEIDRDVIDDEGIDILAKEYEEARRTEATAKGKKEYTKKALREVLEEDKITTASGAKVTFYQAGNPKRLDIKKLEEYFKKIGIKLDDYYVPQTKSERLRVTLPEREL